MRLRTAPGPRTIQRVLAVPKLDVASLLAHQGFYSLPAGWAPRLFRSALFFPRDELERDESRKQLIPYVVLRFQDQVFTYSRGTQSSEKRLVELWSAGLGGHIEWQDDSLFHDAAALYRQAARREVLEEVTVGTTYIEQIVGLLNDDSNAVGRVHLGIVHVWDLASPTIERRERKIRGARFVPLKNLMSRRGRFESWSQLIIDALVSGLLPPWDLQKQDEEISGLSS
jgi:predicted NUDIX family phosphoesterase